MRLDLLFIFALASRINPEVPMAMAKPEIAKALRMFFFIVFYYY
ncbi:MAG: hypothetical protein US63_C0038G0001 [Candidatus Moranbacteria bacterium GW2011_GWC2_37_8]|nr:MAG: hypothetical protein US63_C0038G0001 [Candidatus Moranbacteria bacterium GW2011_GWC2_37_8]